MKKQVARYYFVCKKIPHVDVSRLLTPGAISSRPFLIRPLIKDGDHQPLISTFLIECDATIFTALVEAAHCCWQSRRFRPSAAPLSYSVTQKYAALIRDRFHQFETAKLDSTALQ